MYNNTIEDYYRGHYRAHFKSKVIKDKLESWKDCKFHAEYKDANGNMAWDYIFPGKIYDRIARLLNLKLKVKNKSRVMCGKKLGKIAVENDYLKIRV